MNAVKLATVMTHGRPGQTAAALESLRRAALVAVASAAAEGGAAVVGFAPSGLPGPKGNRETFVWLGEVGRPGIADLEAAAREVEP